ncbi:hypothetical protein Dred_0936 [Desulforamulus reducens MI-1]|uniref:CobQ/CobB/MinD/ParA nucleotide binding domain-containing protein n=1 Tax=Desulforamulus reducens (strain ATCC BAA-1160 / DSM 100696 / MI-1) TaxID=349161 RepID=A4J319_DESRM|nr:hypothetical protein [Desulforamulus reducens]ABO49472.1 hypothetical protein Dred_0936 [Desulforamulus reducens MI-1]
MRILLATSITELDDSLKIIFRKNGIETIGDCYSVEVLVKVAQELGVNTVITTSLMGDHGLLLKAIKSLKENGIRVIILPGDIDNEETRKFVVELVPYGVYDFVFDDITPEKVLDSLMNPAVLGDVPRNLTEAAMSKQKLGQKLETHAEMVSVVAEKQEAAKRKATLTNLLNLSKNNNKHNKNTENTKKNVSENKEPIPNNKKSLSQYLSIPNIRFLQKNNKKDNDIKLETGFANTRILISVWNPLGTIKSFTALNLAIASKNSGLINFDLTCPELDFWFGIKQTKIQEANEKDAGILTMGESMNPELVPKMLREMKWGVRYLPAGNKIGNIGTPNYTDGMKLFKEIIQKAKEEVPILIIDAGRNFEHPATFAALSESDIILVPIFGTPQELGIISQQLTELKRVYVEKPTIELLYVTEDTHKKTQPICDRRIEINLTHNVIINASMQNIPHSLDEGRDAWTGLVRELTLSERRRKEIK